MAIFRRRSKKQKMVVISIAIIGFAGMSGWSYIGYSYYNDNFNRPKLTKDLSSKIKFDAVLPASSSASAAPLYDESKGLLSLQDIIDGVGVSLNQQSLPDSFKTDSQALPKVASSLGATQQILGSNGLTAYLTPSTKAEDIQIAVISNNKALIFIRSQKTIKTDSWKTYILRLKTAAKS